ncbi:MAG: coenzyme synthetase [Frankiales bacterium]|jgi:phenylacetate-CoA ligase|nr:coenzyme synthetase [Frankiales bacterium]
MTATHESSRTGRAVVEQTQLAKARRLLERVRTNPFYGPRYAGTGLAPDDPDLLALWRSLPLVDKADVLADQRAHPPYGTRLGVGVQDVREIHLTSGTSGFGQEAFALTEEDLAVSGSTWGRPLAALGLRPGELFATMYPITFLCYGRSLLQGAAQAGTPVVSLAGADTQLAVSLMEGLQPVGIGARPAFLKLAEESLAARDLLPRDAFPKLRGVVCSGLTATAVAATEQLWDARVHEVYGASQAGGIIAATGPEGAVLDGAAALMYGIEEHFLLEVVDPQTLEPVREGEGEVVLTCLDRLASPIVRYRTRDRVTVVAPGTEDNASPYQAIRVGSIGRYDDMLKIRGNNVWPQQLEEALLGHPAIADFQAEVTLDGRGVDVLAVQVRRCDGGAAPDALWDEVRRRVKRATNVTPKVQDRPDLPPPDVKPRRLLDRR